MFCGQRILKQGASVTVHEDLCIEDLHEALIPKGKDTDILVGQTSQSTEADMKGSLIDYKRTRSKGLFSPRLLQSSMLSRSAMAQRSSTEDCGWT